MNTLGRKYVGITSFNQDNLFKVDYLSVFNGMFVNEGLYLVILTASVDDLQQIHLKNILNMILHSHDTSRYFDDEQLSYQSIFSI